ncbi:MAG TPA: spore maturation protein [Ruminococcaceae bacterium]|jgi:spore maturation protein B|nr:spore maturation protein [Oscillospiraceae bacterium]HBG56051.1 spore maturation protein [Oscillospiraceae bacterium]HBQ45700.1 spore maturation protein [Oscillospiraceae bacterium]HBT90760.1 spore maturation protein [Oscillospiraceae bacterium]HCB90834.1 spore maturation protein [Oscillospiraceae bacterium]
MDKISAWAVPCVILAIVLFGFLRKVPVFDAFVSGAKEGLRSSAAILPSLVGLIMAVSMLSASGALDLLSSFLAPVARALGLPPQVMPLVLIKPVSGSGSTAVLTQIFRDYGPDSFVGRVASVVSGSTETTFYAVAVYYGAVGIRRTRHTVPAALAADLTACVVSALTVRLFFR